MLFPRSSDRGLIEAALQPSRTTFRWGYFRDHLIAASLKLFGPGAPYRLMPYFRDHLIAASLKPLIMVLRLCLTDYFRDHLIAASLKHHIYDMRDTSENHFRDHLIAASLKHCGAPRPRSAGDGGISAII